MHESGRKATGDNTASTVESSKSPPAEIRGRLLWHGEELARRQDWLQQLDQEQVHAISHALAMFAENTATNSEPDPDATHLLSPLNSLLQQTQTNLEHGSGATWIRGFPLTDCTTSQAASVFWSLVHRIGTPVSQTASGERLFDVRDAGFGKEDSRTRGPNTRKRLSFHTDRCDVIGFLCLQQAKAGGENHLVSSAALYNRISSERPDLLAELLRPYPYQRHNVDRGNATAYCYQPIFSFCDGFFATSFLRVLIDRADASGEVPSLTDLQREAIDYLEQTAEDRKLQYRFQLERGDMLFLNNWTTLHRRTEFIDWPEPERRRHLLRVWLSVPNSRPLDPRFAENFGDTRRGALRGGMRHRQA